MLNAALYFFSTLTIAYYFNLRDFIWESGYVYQDKPGATNVFWPFSAVMLAVLWGRLSQYGSERSFLTLIIK